jgi:lathosterol oxidase
MGIITVPTVLPEFYGYSKLYDRIDDFGWAYAAFSIVLFLVFTDSCIYWIHRGLHHPSIYRFIHKPHHAFTTCSPFASHAFHFMDGYFQGLPYHLFVYIFPLHRAVYLFMFILVNLWTVSIHDGVCLVPGSVVNGTAHHNEHHAHFTVNYGQFFTFWDRVCGTYMLPGSAPPIANAPPTESSSGKGKQGKAA